MQKCRSPIRTGRVDDINLSISGKAMIQALIKSTRIIEFNIYFLFEQK